MGGISDFPAGITPDGFPPKPAEHALFRYNFTTGKIEWVPETGYTGGGGGSSDWGDIGGTLSDQTDLQAALDLKAPLASPALTGTPTTPTIQANNSGGGTLKGNSGTTALSWGGGGGANVTIADALQLTSKTASRVLVTDASKNVVSSAVTSTELGYVSGVTSSIQTQLDAKANTASLATVAASGDYDDLINKPTIPTAITLSLIPCSGKASAILAASQAIDGTHKMPLGTPTVGGTPSWLAVAGDTATITGAGIYEISVNSYVLANGQRTTPIGRLSVAGTLEGPLAGTGYIRNTNGHSASSIHIASHLVEITSGSKTVEFWYGNGASVVSSNFSVPAGTSQMVIKKVI